METVAACRPIPRRTASTALPSAGDRVRKLLRHQDGIDDVDDTVVADDVRGNDGRAIHVNLAIGNLDIDRLPIDGGGRRHLHHIGGKVFARNDVIGEDSGKGCFRFRLHKRLDRTRGQFGEGSIGRCQNGERPSALEGFDETCCRYSGNERLE